jgi:hypothetical protein
MPRRDYDQMQLGEKESFEAVVGGKEIILPPELPAKILLDVANYGKGREDLNSEDELAFGFMLIEGVIGKENYDHVFKHLGMNGITKFVEDIMDYYDLGADEDSGAGEATEDGQGKEGEESASGTSSDIGDTSTQTSNGSIPQPEKPSMTLVSTTGRSSPESDTSSQQKDPSSQRSSSKKTRRRR